MIKTLKDLMEDSMHNEMENFIINTEAIKDDGETLEIKKYNIRN